MWTIFLCFNGTLFLEKSGKSWYNQSIMNRLEFQGKECFCYDKTPSEEQLDSIMPWNATLPETCHRTYHQIVENMAEVK